MIRIPNHHLPTIPNLIILAKSDAGLSPSDGISAPPCSHLRISSECTLHHFYIECVIHLSVVILQKLKSWRRLLRSSSIMLKMVTWLLIFVVGQMTSDLYLTVYKQIQIKILLEFDVGVLIYNPTLQSGKHHGLFIYDYGALVNYSILTFVFVVFIYDYRKLMNYCVVIFFCVNH